MTSQKTYYTKADSLFAQAYEVIESYGTLAVIRSMNVVIKRNSQNMPYYFLKSIKNGFSVSIKLHDNGKWYSANGVEYAITTTYTPTP